MLARLLSIASLTGIVEALSGDGLAFSQLDAPFAKSNGLITLKNAQASGISLGLTASGTIDSDKDVLDLSGTVVPAYVVNSVLGRIPVLGTIFTGGQKGGGVFAANYKMTGAPEQPKVSVNPLSALAPGFLRNLFGIFDEKNTPQAQKSSPVAPSATN